MTDIIARLRECSAQSDSPICDLYVDAATTMKRLRDALLWCVAFDGECLADYPAKRAEFEALLLATQEENDVR